MPPCGSSDETGSDSQRERGEGRGGERGERVGEREEKRVGEREKERASLRQQNPPFLAKLNKGKETLENYLFVRKSSKHGDGTHVLWL